MDKGTHIVGHTMTHIGGPMTLIHCVMTPDFASMTHVLAWKICHISFMLTQRHSGFAVCLDQFNITSFI